MIESWRWYGDLDDISLDEIAQTGARGIVTALHEIPYGEVWPTDTIATRKARITQAGFEWVVVESLPVHERIKKGEGDVSALFANYRQSMANRAIALQKPWMRVLRNSLLQPAFLNFPRFDPFAELALIMFKAMRLKAAKLAGA